MAGTDRERLPHILLAGTAETSRFVSPRSGRAPPLTTPPRDRVLHAQGLLGELHEAVLQSGEVVDQQRAFAADASNGIYLTFEIDPGFELKLDSLDYRRRGIELCAVRQEDDKTLATVFVPDGKIGHFVHLVETYAASETATGKPKNRALIESVSHIRLAALQALWTDEPNAFPRPDESAWWEVWLRKSDRIHYESIFREHAPRLGVEVGEQTLRFVDRVVILARGTADQLSRSLHLLAAIAELRGPKATADFFTGMDRREQRDWIEDAVGRLVAPDEAAPAVCLLDTGLNHGHPLLAPAASAADMHTS